jgi:HEAT repeat protein
MSSRARNVECFALAARRTSLRAEFLNDFVPRESVAAAHRLRDSFERASGMSIAQPARLARARVSERENVMKRFIQVCALSVCANFGIHEICNAHGGVYAGPGDTVPPAGGGGGGSGPSGPAPGGPSAGGRSGPTTGAPVGPGGVSSGGVRGPGAGTTGEGPGGADLTVWQFWWERNKAPYLNLKSAIHGRVITGSDDFFLARGDAPQSKDALKPSDGAIRTKVVPALKAALEKETQNDIVTGAMIALAKIGDEQDESGVSQFRRLIEPFLGHANQEVAETACLSLGILANDASVPTLTSLARDDAEGRRLIGSTEVPNRTRAFATYGLGLVGHRTAQNSIRQNIVGVLIELLAGPDGAHRDVKVAALTALGIVAIDVDPSETPASTPGDCASRQSQIRYLCRSFENGSNAPLIRAHAPTAMARLLPGTQPDMKGRVAKVLIGALAMHTKETDEVQQSCVLALGQIGDADKDPSDVEIRSTLKRIVTEGDPQSRHFALIALGQIGGRPGIGDGNDDGLRDVRAVLLTSLTKGQRQIRPWAALGLGVMERALAERKQDSYPPSPISKEAVREVLTNCTVPSDVGAFSIAAGIARDPEAIPILRDKLANIADHEARGYIALALGLIGARDSISPIRAVVRESKYRPALLNQAAIALGLLGDKDLVPDLIGMLSEAKGQATQAALSSALGLIGDSRSIDPLVEMLQNAEITPAARGFAAVALGIVTDKEPLPWNAKISTNINYRASTSTLTGEGRGILDIL